VIKNYALTPPRTGKNLICCATGIEKQPPAFLSICGTADMLLFNKQRLESSVACSVVFYLWQGATLPKSLRAQREVVTATNPEVVFP